MASQAGQRIRAALDQGWGGRETARLLVPIAKVSEARRMSATTGRFASLIDHAKTDDQAQFQGDTCQSPRSMMTHCHFLKESDGHSTPERSATWAQWCRRRQPVRDASRRFPSPQNRRATTRRSSFVQTEP